jgi:hypothetical protein
MTVGQLYDTLGKLVKDGHSETRVIANCDCTLDGIHREFPLLHLCSVYYQSGDIELGFTNVEEESK